MERRDLPSNRFVFTIQIQNLKERNMDSSLNFPGGKLSIYAFHRANKKRYLGNRVQF